tara:strand:- start:643 stop:849 length:207 start_codon:yes stop_codon:yes gene_type:complete
MLRVFLKQLLVPKSLYNLNALALEGPQRLRRIYVHSRNRHAIEIVILDVAPKTDFVPIAKQIVETCCC